MAQPKRSGIVVLLVVAGLIGIFVWARSAARAPEAEPAAPAGETAVQAVPAELPAQAGPPSFEPTADRLARGEYLVEHVADCFACHSQVAWDGDGEIVEGTKGGGGRIPDDMVPFPVYAPNISPDPETGAGTWTEEQMYRALRRGIGHDDRTLFPYMPYPFFSQLADEDLAAIVAYLRSIAPVRNEVPKLELPEELRQALQPLPAPSGPIAGPDAADPVARGRYLVTAASCSACHTPFDPHTFQPLPGMEFAGGAPLHGPWGKVASANLTPDASGISYYDEALFLEAVRTGKVKARELNHIMPWKRFRGMTDDDLKAIFAYLRTLPSVKHRVSNVDPPTPCKLCGGVHGLGEMNPAPAAAGAVVAGAPAGTGAGAAADDAAPAPGR